MESSTAFAPLTPCHPKTTPTSTSHRSMCYVYWQLLLLPHGFIQRQREMPNHPQPRALGVTFHPSSSPRFLGRQPGHPKVTFPTDKKRARKEVASSASIRVHVCGCAHVSNGHEERDRPQSSHPSYFLTRTLRARVLISHNQASDGLIRTSTGVQLPICYRPQMVEKIRQRIFYALH